jgi:ribosomal protein L3
MERLFSNSQKKGMCATFGQKENAAPVQVVEFPKVIVAKKAVTKKKAA